MPPPTTFVPTDTTRRRLLDATAQALAQYGPRKLSLTDIATIAGVSRPTVYRHFASKDDLLLALSEHEKLRFETEMSDALRGLKGPARIKRALQFFVDFQRDYPLQRLVTIEPAFMLGQLEASLRTMAASLVPLFEEASPRRREGRVRADDLADLVVRMALSHFLIRGDDAQLLRQLHHIAGVTS